MRKDVEEFQSFFDTEKTIKRKISSIIPEITEKNDLINNFEQFETEFSKILELEFLSEDLKEILESKLRRIKANFSAEAEVKPTEAYDRFILNISDDIKNGVNENISAFSGDNNLEYLKNNMRNVKSLNELLYMLHGYVAETPELRNELLIIISTGGTDENNNIVYETIRGDRNEYTDTAKKIFYSLRYEDDKSYEELKTSQIAKNTEILALKDRIFIAVNGRGEGLTIEIDESEPELNTLIKYHIPTISNPKYYRNLIGVNRENLEDKDTKSITGSFREEPELVASRIREIFYFVPLDKDRKVLEGDTAELNLLEMHALAKATGGLKPNAPEKDNNEDIKIENRASIKKREQYRAAQKLIKRR